MAKMLAPPFPIAFRFPDVEPDVLAGEEARPVFIPAYIAAHATRQTPQLAVVPNSPAAWPDFMQRMLPPERVGAEAEPMPGAWPYC
jgi:hypothetical protein